MSWNVNGDLITKTINGVQNVVVEVPFYFEKSATRSDDSSTKTVQVRQTVALEYDPTAPFIAYADLTEAVVLGWVSSALGTAGEAYYEAKADEQLALVTTQSDVTGSLFFVDVGQYQEDPETATPLPW